MLSRVPPAFWLVALAAAGCDSAPATCVSSRECAGLVCDLARGECVECVVEADCLEAGQVCRSNRCETLQPCVTSRECPGQVCDLARGFCVDCVGDMDCDGDFVCESGLCVEPPMRCTSDAECADTGSVCDSARGVCVDCVRDGDCVGDAVCRANRCVLADLDAGPGADAGADAGVVGLDGGASDAGFSSDGGAPDAGGSDAGASTDAGIDCEPSVSVSSVAELIALTPASWGTVPETWHESSYTASPTIEATASFTFSSSDFPDPAECSAPCNVIAVGGGFPGVSAGPTFSVTSGARFRLRYTYEDSTFPLGLVVVQNAPCAACAPEERRCSEDSTCYTLGRYYCRACDHGTLARCECVASDGSDELDGTPCSTDGSGDLDGTCADGVCTP